MMMRRERRNINARMADAAMEAEQVSCLLTEATSCVPPTHTWDTGSTVEAGVVVVGTTSGL